MPRNNKIIGRIIYIHAKETIMFETAFIEDNNTIKPVEITLLRRRTKETLGVFKNNNWHSTKLVRNDLNRISYTIKKAISSHEFISNFEGDLPEESNSLDFVI